MSELNTLENPNIYTFASKQKSVPSLLLSSSTKQNQIENTSNSNNLYNRLKLIETIINNKNLELIKIKNKLTEIKKKEKQIENEEYKSNETILTYTKKQEIKEDNKIKGKLNLQNISLNNKLKQITEKADRIEAELLYGEKPGLGSYIKEKLREALAEKDWIILRINENNNEIKKINEKDIKNKYKYNKKIFLDNLDNKKYKINLIKKHYLSENENINEIFNKCIYEEETNKRLNEIKMKEQKYKEMREKELQIIQKRKNIHSDLDKQIKSRNWINNFSNNKNYLSWDEKEKKRIKDEENLISLSNYKRNLMYKSISKEEIDEFSNKIKNEEIKIQNNLKVKKKLLQEFWRERKNMLPKHKSKFFKINIQNDNKIKYDLLLKKEKIKGNMFERLNFSSEVAKKFKPKLIDENIKKERIRKAIQLTGKNKKKEIQELNNKLKLKLIKILNSQPTNFRKKNNLKYSKSVAERQIIKFHDDKNYELTDINKKEKKDVGDIEKVNSENIKNDIFNEYKNNNIRTKTIKKATLLIDKSTGNSDINMNNERKISINNNNDIDLLKSENSFRKYIKEIKTKIKILNQLIKK